MPARRPVPAACRARPVRESVDLDWEGTPVRLVRSTARTRTVQARWRQGRLEIAVPARLSRAEEREWIGRMVDRSGPAPLLTGDGPDDADDLLVRARRLSEEHLDGRARPVSVSWSSRQRLRWGSCTPTRGTIRLSTQLRGMPDWVVDAVLVHELAHLLEPGHGPGFQRLVAGLPRYAEAMAFLAGVTWAWGRGQASADAGPGDDGEAETDDDAAPDGGGVLRQG